MPKVKHKRSMRKGNNPVKNRHHRAALWIRRTLMQKQGGACAICGEQMSRGDGPRQMTIDHVMPVSKGGTSVITNLQLACSACNSAKGDAYQWGDSLEE